MVTAIGTNTVTSVVRHYILPQFTDQVYGSNIFLARLLAMQKKNIQGGTQIEAPLMNATISAGGAYSGFDVLQTVPFDSVANAAWAWKQHYVPYAVDGLTMLKADSPLAIANFLQLQSAQVSMQIADNLAVGVFGSADSGTANGYANYGAAQTTQIDLDGLAAVVGTDALGNLAYGGITRTAGLYWNAKVDNTTATLTQSALQTQFGNQTRGGNHPTVIISGQDQYNRYWALNTPTTGNPSIQYARPPQGADVLNGQAGFTNLSFNGVPWIVDSHATRNSQGTTTSRIYMLNEHFFWLVVSDRGDFVVRPFMEPVNQDAMISMVQWAGNLICTAPNLQGMLSNVNA